MSKEIDYPDWLKIKKCKVITTKDSDENENGILVDILNINDQIMKDCKDESFQQFYMSTVHSGMFKGLHVHPYKVDCLHVVHGLMGLVLYPEVIKKENIANIELDLDKIILIEMGRGYHKTVIYPSKYPHGFFGIEDAVIINYRRPAWTPVDTFQYDIYYNPIVEMMKKKYGY